MAASPSRQVCQMCALDDDDLLTWELEAAGLWRFTCTNHPEPHTWLTTGRDPLNESGHDGISKELGVYDDLLACFKPGEPWLEYGVVEHRYATANPHAYRRLVRELFTHTAAPDFKTGDFTVSAFLGARLGDLQREGLLARRSCKATGSWSYNGTLNAWMRAPADPDRPLLSWQEYAPTVGADPTAWPLDQLAG